MEYKATIGVFLSSKSPAGSNAAQNAYELGKHLTLNGFRVVFGGRPAGCMGALAKGVDDVGGRAIGFVPERLRARQELWFDEHTISDELDETAHPIQKRKHQIASRADGFVAAPGGLGTLDELAEIMALNQLGYRNNTPVVLLNPDGYWNHLISHLRQGFERGYIPRDPFKLFLSAVETPAQCADSLNLSLTTDRPLSG